MSRYAVDTERRELLATWGTGLGDAASRVTDIPTQAADEQAFAVAETLTALCEQLWYTYTHPASGADSLEPNTEGWRRDEERQAFACVVDAVRNPNLPHDGFIVQSYSPVEESSHRLGRALHAIGDPSFLQRIVAEVETELAAVEQSERGDLTGRARQAVLLTRADASPAQVAAADALLREDPFGDERLFTAVEPSAAAVAAAHWLGAAAEVAAEIADLEPTDVVIEADNIEALPCEHGCLLLYQEYASDIADDDPLDKGGDEGRIDEENERVRAAFLEQVRDRAMMEADRLL